MADATTKKATLLKRAVALLSALMKAFRFARKSGLTVPAMVAITLRRLSEGPRPFARRVVSFAGRGAVMEAYFEPSIGTEKSPYEDWIDYDARENPYKAIASERLISIVMPTCETPSVFLEEVVASVLSQSYPHWELCIADDASTEPHVRDMLERYMAKDRRIQVIFRDERGGISEASNTALQLARGEVLTFLDHDDLLHPDALGEVMSRFAAGDVDIVYTDHDAMSPEGIRRFPFFKPDYTLDLLLSQMYIGHLVAFDRCVVEAAGGFLATYDGAQDYDLLLRCVGAGARVGHVPKTLYHWREHSGSTSANIDSKPYAHEAGRKAIQAHLDAHVPGAIVDDGVATFCYDVRYPIGEKEPLVSIIIPTKDRIDLLETCVNSIWKHTRYSQFEILVVDNGSEEQATHDWLRRHVAEGSIKVIDAPVPFNWSLLNNLAVKDAAGEILLFLNNDTEVFDGEWLRRLCENVLRPEIAIAGPLLLYPDRTIQHAGVVVGMGGWADHVFKAQEPAHNQVLYVSPVLRRNVLAVTGACMAMRKDTFDLLGGFDEAFIVCGSDVEICLRAVRAGLLNVYVPEAQLVHHESKTRDPRAIPDSDFVLSAAAYEPYKKMGDPYFSRNLDLMSTGPKFRVG